MREVLVVNPRKKRKTSSKPKKRKSRKRRYTAKTTKGVATMPKKKRRSKKRKYTKNPTRVGRAARRASRTITKSFMGLNFKKAFGEMPYVQLGMFAAKWAAKRLGSEASETDPESWTWDSYLKAGIGAVAGAMLVNAFKPGKGQKVLEGGLNFAAFKAIQNELIAGSEWASAQFGEEDWTDLDGYGQDEYVPTEYLLTGTDQEPYAYDDEGNLYPADDRHRLPEISGALEPVGPLGAVLEPVGPLGQDPWAKAFME